MSMLRSRFGARPPGADLPPEPLGAAPVRVERAPGPPPPEERPLPEPLRVLRSKVHQCLIDDIDQQYLSKLSRAEARKVVGEAALELLSQEQVRGLAEFRERLVEDIADEVLGLGPLEPLLRDDSVSEIMVNGPDRIYVERSGLLQRTTYSFRDEEHLERIIERIVSAVGRHVDEASPMVDARLHDGSRVNVVIPPAAPGGAKLTLRKFARQRFEADDLVRMGSISEEAVTFLRAAVRARLNMLVSGGTGSGKTTLLNVLSSFIGDEERIVTIEDPLELQLQQDHVVALEARPISTEGATQVTQRDLVRNALRMRPDRIIVGEVRSGEAFDMLQAMNTGHEGSISTVHANSPRDALSRVQNMVLMAGFDLPDRAIREQIASALHLVIQIGRMADGSRKVTQITEVAGIEGQTITMQDLFHFEGSGRDDQGRVVGKLLATGLQPHHSERFVLRGVPLPVEALRNERMFNDE
jgi:pilus assembly protein CpaF